MHPVVMHTLVKRFIYAKLIPIFCMNEKPISSNCSLAFKYGLYIFLTIFILLSLILLTREFTIYNLVMVLIAGLILVLVIFYLRTLKNVSFDEHELIIRDLNSTHRVDLSKIKRIYRIDLSVFYRIEFTNDGTYKYIDVWPSTNIIETLNGKLPKNFDELLSLIEK